MQVLKNGHSPGMPFKHEQRPKEDSPKNVPACRHLQQVRGSTKWIDACEDHLRKSAVAPMKEGFPVPGPVVKSGGHTRHDRYR